MKIILKAFLLLSACQLFSVSAFAQGSLTPPGAPTPTMKSLDEIDAKLEKRTPISSAPFTINTSGSYYLTANLTVTTGSAVTITVDDVTLDLNGFTISSTASPASGTGVLISGVHRNVSVKHGNIRGTTTVSAGVFTTGGFVSGVSGTAGASGNIQVRDVNVAGIGGEGINLSVSTPSSRNIIEHCTASVCSGTGLRAGSVINSKADSSGGARIIANIVSNCFGESLGGSATHHGINGVVVVENSVGIAAVGDGIHGGAQVSNSHGTSVSGIGLVADGAQNSQGVSSSGTGVNATTATNCIGTSTSGSFGINASIASFCRATRNGGTAIAATTAIGCVVLGTGTVTATNKFLGTP